MKKNMYVSTTFFLKLSYIAILCILSLNQLQLTIYPEILSFLPILSLEPVYLVLNLLLLVGIFLFLAAPWKRISTGGILFSVCSLIATIANLYTNLLHGSLLTIAELKNTGTALQVIKNYNFFGPNMPKNLLPIFLLFLLEIGLSLCLRFFVEKKISSAKGKRLPKTVAFLTASVLSFFVLNANSVTPYLDSIRNHWLLIEKANVWGYPLSVLAKMDSATLVQPHGYSEESLDTISLPVSNLPDPQQPDIFLILNETFYDPALIADIETDVDYMADFYAIEGAKYGYSVCRAGGGTNDTEFEMLTSIPQYLVGATPFNLLDMTDCASVVSVMQQQGYYTIVGHPGQANSYNRDNAYPQIGFDEIHFKDDFTLISYGERGMSTDASDYADMLGWYEQAVQTGKPVFTYLLTLQNHGGWDSNPAEYDTVHLMNYTGEYSESEMNEFLTGIQMSGKALADLCDYFRNSDRPVIICMLGDHSPSFYNFIISKELGPRKSIETASTPLFYWANFELDIPDDGIGYRSITSVVPLLLDLAGVESSAYYRYILSLSEDYPVITNWGNYMDSQSALLSYQTKSTQNASIWDYFYLAHNNLLPESREEWFTLSTK